MVGKQGRDRSRHVGITVPNEASRHLLQSYGVGAFETFGDTFQIVSAIETEAVIAAPGGAMRVYSVHLDHVSADERIAQLHHLTDRINAFIQEGGSLSGAHEFGLSEPPLPEDYVIMGDFNMEPESPEYCAFAGSVDRFYGRTARIGTPIDAFAALRAHTPGSYSWMDPKDHGKRMHLDYCFVSCGLKDRLKSAVIDTDSLGSDHFPLRVEIGD